MILEILGGVAAVVGLSIYTIMRIGGSKPVEEKEVPPEYREKFRKGISEGKDSWKAYTDAILDSEDVGNSADSAGQEGVRGNYDSSAGKVAALESGEYFRSHAANEEAWTDAGNPNLFGEEYQYDLIKKEISEGLIPKNIKKVWSTCADGRVCPPCAMLEGMTVGIDEYFRIGEFSVLHPPLHDGCRCAIMYEEPQSVKGYSFVSQRIKVLKLALEEMKNTLDPHSTLEYLPVAIQVCEDLLPYSKDPKRLKRNKFLEKIPGILDDLVYRKDEKVKTSINNSFAAAQSVGKIPKTSKGRIKCIEQFRKDMKDLPEEYQEYVKALTDEAIRKEIETTQKTAEKK